MEKTINHFIMIKEINVLNTGNTEGVLIKRKSIDRCYLILR